MRGKYKLTAYFARNVLTSRFIEDPEFIGVNVLKFKELGLFYDDEPELYDQPIDGVILSGCSIELVPYKE